MQPELQQRFDIIERQRLDIQAEVAALSDAQVSWKPNAETWSIQQIVEHLVLSDETLGQAQDAAVIKPEALPFRLVPRALRRALVLYAFQRDAALPLPSPAIDPAGNVPLPELITRWETSRAEMRRALEIRSGNEKQYAHPVLGPLTAGQMLKLTQVHTLYHWRQIQSIQRADTAI